MSRPSDRSIAQAYRELVDLTEDGETIAYLAQVEVRAAELDATAAASPSQPDALETKIYSAENFDKSRLA